jgi:hypothetical protein
LTSFLASVTPEGNDLQVAIYTDVVGVNQEGVEVPQTLSRTRVPLSRMYVTAATNPSVRVIGGVAFIHMSGNFSCAPPTYSPEGTLPTECAIELKVKLVAFHCLGLSGGNVSQITYSKRQPVVI